MGNTVMASGPRSRLGTAEIQRLAENPRWPDVNTSINAAFGLKSCPMFQALSTSAQT
jgi:hypothetical protein